MFRVVTVFATSLILGACAENRPSSNASSPEIIFPNPDNFGLRDRNYSLTESPDGKTRVFVGQRGDETNLYVSRKSGTVWSEPAAVVFQSREIMMSPHFSPLDGRLYFATDAQHPNRRGREDLNIWSAVLNDDNTLSDARPMPDEINTGGEEDSIAFAEDGTFAFTSTHTRGVGGFDIYYGKVPADGDAWTFQPMPHNTRMADTQVAMLPSGDAIFYYAHLPDILGAVDLFRVDRTENGWSSPVNLGAVINTVGIDYGPGMSADGRTFFFSRDGQLMQIDLREAMKPPQ